MNDPFDVYIDDLFGMDLEEFYKESIIALLDLIEKNPQRFSQKIQVNLDQATQVSEIIRNASEGKKEDIKQKLVNIDLTEFDPTFAITRENLRKSRDQFAEKFKNYGIFCATKTCENLLMWAHYADKHKGVVIGLKADLEKDSFLRLVEPVEYKCTRPYMFESTEKWLNHPAERYSMEMAKEATQRLLHTKSKEWSYEEEVRLAIPDEVKPNEAASFLKFHPNELVELYLGYRMGNVDKNQIATLARILNPEVRIFHTKLSKRDYALEFEEV